MGEGVEREAAIFVEIYMVVALFGWSFCDGVQRIADVQEKNRAVRFEESSNVLRQSVDGLVYDQLVRIAAPGSEAVGEHHTNHQQKPKQKACSNL